VTEFTLPIVLIDDAHGESPDSRLIVINTDPGDDEVGAPRGGAITFDIIDTVTPEDGVKADTIEVTIEGALAWSNEAAQAGFSGSASALDGGGIRLTITRAANFDSSQVVNVTVAAASIDGDADVESSWSFTIEDYSAPELIGAIAAGHRQVNLIFDEPVQIPDGSTFEISSTSAPAVEVAVVSSAVDGATIILTLDRDLSPGASYEVTVNGVTDLVENEIAADSTASFAGFTCRQPSGRRFRLWEMIPRYNRLADDTGDLKILIDAWQELVDLTLCDIDNFSDIYDIERTSEAGVDLLLFQLGCPFETALLPVVKKRRLVGALTGIYQSKGTIRGMVNAIRFFLGIEVEIRPIGHGLMRLGISELGDNWVLGTSDRRLIYSFVVESPVILSDEDRESMRSIVMYMKPVREHLAAIIEPADEPEDDHWILGLSELGVGTILES
jgi:phage tail-like protein